MLRAAATLVLGATLAAQVPAGPVVQKLGGDLYAYVSDNDSSCNSTFLVGSDRILVVDTGFDAGEANKLLGAIRTVSPLPVRHIVNTHYHRDHQAGNGIVGPDAEVISTEWTRQKTLEFLADDLPRLEKTLKGEALESLRSARFRPATLTFSGSITLYVDPYPVEVSYPGRGHTSGDALVYFPRQRVMAAGDLYITRASPAMDQGSVLSWIEVLEQMLRGPAETFVPGHFEVASKADVQRFHDYLADLRDQVSTLIKQGASLDQVRRSLNMQRYSDFRQFPQFRATFADNAEVVYRELVKP